MVIRKDYHCGIEERRGELRIPLGPFQGHCRAECKGTLSWDLVQLPLAGLWGEDCAQLVSEPLAFSRRPLLPAWLPGDKLVEDRGEPGTVAMTVEFSDRVFPWRASCSDFMWFRALPQPAA